VTIILTTHYIEEAEEMADRVGVINKGTLMLVEDKKELMKKTRQETAHAAPAESAAAHPRGTAILGAGAQGRRQRHDLQRSAAPTASTFQRCSSA